MLVPRRYRALNTSSRPEPLHHVRLVGAVDVLLDASQLTRGIWGQDYG
ncbi:MAG: hypothetical protein M3Q03_08550 [Chloroflexota bacterium]|nr:hypothetical protein [Chloroflexota bacterium]